MTWAGSVSSPVRTLEPKARQNTRVSTLTRRVFARVVTFARAFWRQTARVTAITRKNPAWSGSERACFDPDQAVFVRVVAVARAL